MLFGITQKGMTVVIADNNAFPSEVVHPGMILGQYARNEFIGVDAAMKKSQYSQAHVETQKSTSVVVSSRDKTISVWEDDGVIATGKVEITHEKKPLSDRAYMLAGTDSSKQDLRWSSVGYGKTDREDLAAQLRRIKAEPQVREEIRKRMHPGMTVVTTNRSSTEASRTSRGFVIIDGIY
jgi:hypothetical protein